MQTCEKAFTCPTNYSYKMAIFKKLETYLRIDKNHVFLEIPTRNNGGRYSITFLQNLKLEVFLLPVVLHFNYDTVQNLSQ